MAFNDLILAQPQVGKGHTFATVMSAVADAEVGLLNLKATAATLSQRMDPVGSALANGNVLDISGATRLSFFARITNLASLVWSADARVMIFAGRGDLSKNAAGVVTVQNVNAIELIDYSVVTTADGSNPGVAVGIPASPSTSNMLLAGSWLYAPAMQFTDPNGTIRTSLDCRAFNFCIPILAKAATGTPVANESSQLVVVAQN